MKRAALLLCILLTGCGGAGEATAPPKGDQAFCEELRADLVEAETLGSLDSWYSDRDHRGYLLRRLAPTGPEDVMLTMWWDDLQASAYAGGQRWDLALNGTADRCLTLGFGSDV